MNESRNGNAPQAQFFSELASSRFPFGLGSDNHSATHPRILKALELVNQGFAPSYGTDAVTDEAMRVFRQHFGPATDVHFCFNGTAANVLAMAPLVSSHHAIICSDVAHIDVDECAAPEKLLGTKLIKITTRDGKLRPEQIEPLLIRRGDQHFAQAKLVSITQPTELGTVYTGPEIAALVEFCSKHDLWLHIDGARFINAATSLGCDLKSAALGADVLSFGGTKNGLMFGEAVLFLSDRARMQAKDFPYIRKQFMQLPSKTRFISAQFIELLATDLWKQISSHSIARARQLRAGLETIPSVNFTQETQANAVFAIFERNLEKILKKSAFFYIWNEETREARLMTTWSTTPTNIEEFVNLARSQARG